MLSCRACGSALLKPNAVYCSNKCQGNYNYLNYIAKWRAGVVDGTRGVEAKNISSHISRYLREKYTSCVLCGWDNVNPVTGRVPLEIDHLDGNSENNTEQNLRLICPNCHALSLNFRNLNKGHGRNWRRNKYLKSAI